MTFKNFSVAINWCIVFCLFVLLVGLEAAPVKVRVTVDNAQIKATKQIGGKDLTRVSLGTVLEAEGKEGEWYKVSWQGVTGYIHEMLVEMVRDEEVVSAPAGVPGRPARTQADIVAEIGIKMEEGRNMIRLEKDYEKAVSTLRSLIARVFSISDPSKQKELATELYLWIGYSYATQGDALAALTEFRNMFEVDQAYAKNIIRLIPDPKIVALCNQAEKVFLGLVTEYSLEITTDPKEATIKINGKEVGHSPEIYATKSPEFVLEIEKKGYKTIKEELFLTQATTRKHFVLEKAGRDVEVKSNPPGARVFIDGQDTQKLTNCVLPAVSFGLHAFKITKEDYSPWEGEVNIEFGEQAFPLQVSLTPTRYEFFHKYGGPAIQIFKNVAGVAVDDENNIYLASEGTMRIQKISSDWKFENTWADSGKETRVIKSPGGIAVDTQGNIYVTDTKSHCVLKFSKTGKLLRKWGQLGSGNPNFNTPLGIAVDSKNNVYVVDSANSRLKKYDGDGKLLRVWGRQSAADGGFVFPSAVTVTQKDEILVLDRVRVQKFTPEGEFISKWGKPGSGDGEFKNPMGICIDENNFIYIADTGNDRAQKFDEEGNFITRWGVSGTGSGQMSGPVSIAIDSRGIVYVAEKDNNRLQLFKAPEPTK